MIAQLDDRYLRLRPWKVWSRLWGYGMFEGRPLTTKGQWINPIVFAQFAITRRMPQLRRVEKPVFILGTGRSGTTVLGMVLSMHRHVGFLNEPKALWHSIHPEEDLIGSYSDGAAHYRLGAEEATPARVRGMHRLFGAYLAVGLSRRLVDKYPELVFRVPYVEKLFPDARFLFLVRNGWGTCQSIFKWSERLGFQEHGEVHDWWGRNDRKWRLLVEQVIPEHDDLAPHQAEIAAITNHVDRAAVEWIVTMREGLTLSGRSNVLTVRYEELCEKPESTLSVLREFLELDTDPTFMEYGKETLRPTRTVPPLALNPLIARPFQETMERLGYA